MTQKSAICLRYAKFIVPAALFILVVSYFFIDRPLSTWAATLPAWVAPAAKMAVSIFSSAVSLVVWPLIFYFYTFVFGKSTFRKELLFIALALPATVLVVYICKFTFGRARPEFWLQQGLYTFHPFSMSGSWQSFPSGHGGSISALMAALSCFRPRLTWLFALMAFALSSLRVLALDHFFSDICGSIFIAFFVVQSLYLPYQRRGHLLWKNSSRTRS